MSTLATAVELNLETNEPTPISQEQWKDWFQTWLEVLAPDLNSQKCYELSLRLTDDLEIQTFNLQYRSQDRPTDVLAFAALEAEVPEVFELDEPLYLGDLLISVETAERQALERGHSLTWELAWLAAHGLLHLLGWDHPDEPSLERMLEQQDRLLQATSLHSDCCPTS
ncbi:rRNA maturation RNase YbeY [Leptolyngbya sp. FACHB-261]|uniref:rRNA maturation RNase YbeY n=1 Tax=Leptolyngbya sp. FACHB-261 TaxID=2692806 RepID=UPI001F559619|nr:rRNA maturation RNase YbeY [Leptolyngbya sp. FACHB-261]